MLTADRPQFAPGSVRCFANQTYENRRLLIFDSGAESSTVLNVNGVHYFSPAWRKSPVGTLRNEANFLAARVFPKATIFVHWDDDDWSHPNRIAEQVRFLVESKAEVVGYDQVLFSRNGQGWKWANKVPGLHPCGSSLCYWRDAWAKDQFHCERPSNSESTSEYHDWLQRRQKATCSAFGPPDGRWGGPGHELRLIARIHGANTTRYNLDEQKSPSWSRQPAWDPEIRRLMGDV